MRNIASYLTEEVNISGVLGSAGGFRGSCEYLLVDVAVRRPVIDEDTNDVHVPPPRSQVQRETAFAVGHVRRRLELEQLQHHVSERRENADGSMRQQIKI